MTESPITRASLVLRLRDRDDHGAWGDFVDSYGPMLYRFIRSRGLQDSDASDLVQDVMRSVGMAIGRLDYAKEKGGFRAWLFTITRNKLSTYFEKRKRIGPTANDTAQFEMLGQIAGNDELQQQWELEHQRQLIAQAMADLKPTIEPKTWSAFELTAIEGMSAEEAGKQTGMSKGAVYVARSRVTAKLRNAIETQINDES
ncbi:RNA polymerase sigma factor CnrH [Stieleria bergensis]|uniref:RNA polymerase sigma factor CnrH n=1 Tax=Stieleria bergensis TaxID=2528025 RepID=A0A517SWR9_9BACT|nr:RNA polymerase sigma factor CnrH [Planctomycetes bacterium SV_7m_r]